METAKQRALVTGASSGLGVEFARVLADRGIDLVISARRKDRLEILAAELRQSRGVEVAIVPADLSTQEGPRQLFDAVQAAGLRIDILINNAGFGHFGPFLEQSHDEIDAMIAVNVRAVTILTRLFCETMKRQGSGHILQVSSFAALQPIPRYSVYSAAKEYVITLAQALRHELRKTEVNISVVAPGFMPTEFHDVAEHEKSKWMKLLTVPSDYVARKAIHGMFKRKLLITPGLVYQINRGLLRLTPRRIASALSAAVVKS
ncbi:MAG: SDR family oxidoreductase [Pirellulales bacterium]|nr:SDR family oxidoreductase [Pirellulales bacterium]